MTEDLWLNGNDPIAMLTFLRRRASERQLRLYSVALCSRFININDFDESTKQHALRFLDKVRLSAEGVYSAAQLQSVRWTGPMPRQNPDHAIQGWDELLIPDLIEAIHIAAGPDAYAAAEQLTRRLNDHIFSCFSVFNVGNVESGVEAECQAMREIFGNPSRPFSIEPRWLTTSVFDLANVIYEEQDYGRLPILADALMDAGCDNERLILHCRNQEAHVRGCWVIDALLGKEKPKNAAFYCERSRMHLNNNQLHHALADCSEEIRLDSKCDAARLLRTEIYRRLDERSEADRTT